MFRADDPRSLGPVADLIARLRVDCPWDKKLSLADLRAYLIEEAHELAAAIDARDSALIEEELGDLLFEAVYVAHLAKAELEQVEIDESIRTVIRKMVTRHPHVFGSDEARSGDRSAADVQAEWEQRKPRPEGRSALDGVPVSLPALVGAYRLGQKAAGFGFDWAAARDVRAKVGEELRELDRELTGSSGADNETRAKIEEELGDLLFAVANLARRLDIDPERALAGANRKFRRRFAAVEAAIDNRDGDNDNAGAGSAKRRRQKLEELWERVKRDEGDA